VRLVQNINNDHDGRNKSLMLAGAVERQQNGVCTADMSALELPVTRADQLWCAASTSGTALQLTFDIRFLLEQLHDVGSTKS
jgi:hypothetical protein